MKAVNQPIPGLQETFSIRDSSGLLTQSLMIFEVEVVGAMDTTHYQGCLSGNYIAH